MYVAISLGKKLILILMRTRLVFAWTVTYTLQWTIMNLQGQKMLPVKAELAICSPVIDVRIWIMLECGFHVKL